MFRNRNRIDLALERAPRLSVVFALNPKPLTSLLTSLTSRKSLWSSAVLAKASSKPWLMVDLSA